jgi:hypothetical protein
MALEMDKRRDADDEGQSNMARTRKRQRDNQQDTTTVAETQHTSNTPETS